MSTTAVLEPLLTIDEAATYLGTGERFMRRLVAERRIRFVKVGKFVRFPESALVEFVASGTKPAVSDGKRPW